MYYAPIKKYATLKVDSVKWVIRDIHLGKKRIVD